MKEEWILTLPRSMEHGDWKTALRFPDRWPTLKAGTVVKTSEGFPNFYGFFFRCITDDGKVYDLDSAGFGQEGRKVVREMRALESTEVSER